MAASKQCSKCGEGYDYDLKACPGCGYQGYKIITVGESLVSAPLAGPPGAEPAAAPVARRPQLQAQRLFAWLAVALMIVSLFMVWVQASVVAATYLKICEMVANNLNDAVDLAGVRVLGVFIPALAALGLLSGAIGTSHDRSAGVGFVGVLGSGLLATLAAWQISDYVGRSGAGFVDLSGALGAGFQLYTGAAIAAVLVGIWGVLSSPNAIATEGGPSAAAAFGGFLGFAQEHRGVFVAVGIACVLVGAGIGLYPKLQEAREKAQTLACSSNAKQVSIAVLQYTQDFDEKMPIEGNWCEAIYPYTRNDENLVCPALRKSKSGYAMNRNTQGAPTADLALGSALLFEYSGGWNGWGVPSQDLAYRHKGSAWYVANDGHAAMVSSGGDLLSLDGPDLRQTAAEGDTGVGPDAPAEPDDTDVGVLVPYDGGDGFTVLRPDGWEPERTSQQNRSTVEFKNQRGVVQCKVQWSPQPASESLDAYPLRTETNWRKRGRPYQRVALAPVSVSGRDGLRWEFVREVDGQTMHTLDVFVNYDGMGYALWFRAPESEWSSWGPMADKIVTSFQLQ